MPAVERQLFNSVLSVNPALKNLVVISPKEQTDLASWQEVKENVSVSDALSVEQLASQKDLEAVIVNKAITETLSGEGGLDAVIRTLLGSLGFGGIAIIREDISNYNAKKMAQLTDYIDVFRTVVDGKNAGFALYSVSEVDNSVYAHHNWHDYFWVLIKKEFPATTGDLVTFRDFLDKTQYTDTGIFAYEWIFGEDFISPGGWSQNVAILKRFKGLDAGKRMLDIGVGIGGGARQAASEFGVHVHGVDLSSNMLAVALDRNHRDKDCRVTYQICDAMIYDFPETSFDYVFSRDCIQHIPDTKTLFQRIYKCLKPGGKLLITMYGVGHGELSPEFKSYVAQRQYYLKNLKEIEEVAKTVGFIDIETENLTPRFKEILGEERHRVESNKEEFLQKFSQKEYDSLVKGWSSKLQYIADDNHNWNLFFACKPE